MLWSFIAVCLSAWLYVDASYRGPAWQRWFFKPVTLLLLLLLAWQAPMFDAISYLVLAGLCASLVGDALTLLPRQRLLYAVGAFFLIASALHHLLCQPNDVVVLLAAAAGVTDSRRVAYRRYLDATGGATLAGMYFYRHDAGHGLAGGRTVVLPPNGASPFGLYRRDAAVHRQYRLAG